MTRLLPVLLALGCAPSLSETHVWDDGDGSALGKVVTSGEGDGVMSTTVDATDATAWTAVDLDADAVEADYGDDVWDLAFQRFEIAVNGGVTGPGGVEAVFMEGLELSDVTAIPEEGWATDEPDGPDENALPDYVFRPWFDYDGDTHVVSAHPAAFAVRSTEGRHFALQMLEYYDDAGSPGMITFRWKRLD